MMQLDTSTSSISTPINPIPSEHPLRVEAITYMDNDLFKAAQDGDMELFHKYQGGLHCLVDGKQNTALHIYSRTRGRQVVEIDKGFLRLPFRRVASKFSNDFVEQLVDKCPSLLLQPNAKGEIPLHVAARYGRSDIVKLLIDRAKLVPQEDLEKGWEATTLKQMLRMTDNDRNTAMHKAVESGELDVVRLLVNELDPEFSFSANTSGETPLFVAAKAKRNLLVAEILNNCKSIDYDDPDGRTALHAAVIANDEKSVRKLMEANKHLTKKTDDNGRTPLHYAARDGFRLMVKLLLERNASAAYITDKERGWTALHMAACGGRGYIMRDIISYCPGCCEIVDKRGWNFLHFAVLALEPIRLFAFLAYYKNNNKHLAIKNVLDEKDVNGNRPLEILLYGRPYWDSSIYHQVFKFYRVYGSQDIGYALSSATKKKQIRALVKDIANDEEVLASSFYRIGKIVKELEDEEKEGDIPQHEIEDKARASRLVVPTLVATVTFAAAFTVPGGYKSDEQGTATLIRDSAFKAFVIANSLGFGSSLSAITFYFMSAISPMKLRRFPREPIRVADCLTSFAIYMMLAAFSTGTYAVLQSSSSLAVVSLILALFAFFLLPELGSVMESI